MLVFLGEIHALDDRKVELIDKILEHFPPRAAEARKSRHRVWDATFAAINDGECRAESEHDGRKNRGAIDIGELARRDNGVTYDLEEDHIPVVVEHWESMNEVVGWAFATSIVHPAVRAAAVCLVPLAAVLNAGYLIFPAIGLDRHAISAINLCANHGAIVVLFFSWSWLGGAILRRFRFMK